MGVHGLWELLAPVGRRVSVETLAGKKLAIDASIWMIQFMKAMRDERGEMVRNAHILGFFRRICKLLYLRTKPVFVFDGGTPALKRRTVIARRRQRENAQAKIRKTAEKLLLNHLKSMRLKEMAADLEKQRQQNDPKGKKPIIEELSLEQNSEKANNKNDMSYNQEELDQMLAASLAAEESEGFNDDASTSGTGVPLDKVFGDEDEGDGDDEDEEMILPEMHGKIDPAILASLPPSMQLDLLVQMRERLMAENRQKYQKVKKAPARFSELQIQAYLKTVAFRREIDGVQKAATGRGIGGVQTSRIASEANREFIFSSSFSGDKQAFTSAGQVKTDADQSLRPPVNSLVSGVSKVKPTGRSGAAAGPAGPEAGKAYHGDVETYQDERGRVRVSRVRALGIRMTRDLQRNLDMMKEIELDKAGTNQKNDESNSVRNLVDVLGNSSDRIQHRVVTSESSDGLDDEAEKTKESAVEGTPIELCFEDTCEHGSGNEDDDLFARLVAGEPVLDFSVNASASAKQSSYSTSDCEWEEGVIEEKIKAYPSIGAAADEGEVQWEKRHQVIQLESTSCQDEKNENDDEGEVEWEEGYQDTQVNSSYQDEKNQRGDGDEVEWEEGFQDTHLKPTIHLDEKKNGEGDTVDLKGRCEDTQLNSASYSGENHKTVSKGAWEEEAEVQEAIRRSLEDVTGRKFMKEPLLDKNSEIAGEAVSEDIDRVSVLERRKRPEFEASAMNITESTCLANMLETNDPNKMSAASLEIDLTESNLNAEILSQETGRSGALTGQILAASDTSHEENVSCEAGKQMDTLNNDGSDRPQNEVVGTSDRDVALNNSNNAPVMPSLADSLPESLLDSDLTGAQQVFQAAIDDNACENGKFGNVSDSITDVFESGIDKTYGEMSLEREEPTRKHSLMDVDEKHEVMGASLEEEMVLLDRERDDLGNEQRKLERNAESVSSEMFVECQELLQMFGLPYIIAPMEAEAQCAFMELSNLVDGVVTDDSDAFLFGARSVYKNIFDDRKYVETYLMKDIESELGLDREKLIHMALLLGSDYTEGVSGIGIVNAIEVVNAFPEKGGLRDFREWIESPDPTILGKLDGQAGSNSKKKVSTNGSSSNIEGPCQSGASSEDDVTRIKQIFMDKHRNVSKNWHIPSTFPSDAVISAYASPQVDKSTEPFSWGKPDLSVLRKLCWEKFGWGTSKADELLLPVLKEYNKHETQLRLEAFYTFNERFAKIRSKRIKKAVKGIAGDKSSELMDETMAQQSGTKKRKAKSSEIEANQSSSGVEAVNTKKTSGKGKKAVKQSRGRRMKEKISDTNLENCENADTNPSTMEKSVTRERHRGQPCGRGRREKNACVDTETSGDGAGSCGERDGKLQLDTPEPHQVRRSGRVRKLVNYKVSDEFVDSDKENESCPIEDAMKKELFGDQEGGVSETSEKDPSESKHVELEGDLVNETEQAYNMDGISTSLADGDPTDEPTKDYLQLGGGFCMDEDEHDEFNDHASSATVEGLPDNFSIVNANSMEEKDHEAVARRTSSEWTNLPDTEGILKDKEQNDGCSLDETENDSRSGFIGSLRAMPNLRRKRRKT